MLADLVKLNRIKLSRLQNMIQDEPIVETVTPEEVVETPKEETVETTPVAE